MWKAPESGIPPERPGHVLRLVLLVGFGGLLALALGAGLEALSSLHQIQAEEQQARAEYLARNQSLLAVRSSLDDCGAVIREYFLSYDPASHADAADEFPRLFKEAREALAAYPPPSSAEEMALLATMRTVLAEQELAVAKALVVDRGITTRYVYEEVLPRHAVLLATVGRIALWDSRQLNGIEAYLVEKFRALRADLIRLLTIMLGSGLLLSIGSIVYILRQDREARQRYSELAESRREMSNLSARLLEIQEEERRSISRELHDEVGQSLGALLVDVGRLAAVATPGSPAQEQLDRVKALAERSVNSVRNMALLLRPSMLDDLGLVPALEWQAREVSRRSEMEVEVESPGVPENLAEEKKICIYRVAQEALNNAARHSGGHNARVTIGERDGAIVLSIHDDGKGFDPHRSRGLGLLGMEERVRRLGGAFHVDSKPGAGTTIEVTLPL